MNGRLSCLQWARERSTETCQFAARVGNLSCLQYDENGWSTYTCQFAASVGNLSCLQYAHENGCPWNKHDCLLVAIVKTI